MATPLDLPNWKLVCAAAGLQLLLFLIALESTIVGPALVVLANEFDDFRDSGWVLVGYLAAFTGTVLVQNQIVQFYGAKATLLLAVFIFTIASCICGAASSLRQLIAFRVIQGFGASGLYVGGLIVGPALVPRRYLVRYTGTSSAMYIGGSVLGIVLGGVIVQATTWRWIFWLNGPLGGIACVLLLISLKSRNRSVSPPTEPKERRRLQETLQAFLLLDWPGIVLILPAAALFVTAIELGGTSWGWSDAKTITCLACGIVAAAAFLLYERYISLRPPEVARKYPRPLLPWQVLDRCLVTQYLSGVLCSVPYFGSILTLPIRFQLVNSASVKGSAIRLLPMLLTIPLGILIATRLISRYDLPILPIQAAVIVLSTLAIGILSTAPFNWNAGDYVLEAVAGFAFGPAFTMSLTFVQSYTLSKKPKLFGYSSAAMIQARIFGAAIGFAALTNIIVSELNASNELTAAEVLMVSTAPALIARLPPEKIPEVRTIFEDVFRVYFIVLASAGAGGLSLLCGSYERTWRRVFRQQLRKVNKEGQASNGAVTASAAETIRMT